MINLPPSTRIALGTANVNGKQVEVYMSPEWARYFETLNVQTNVVVAAVDSVGATNTAGAAVSFIADGGDSVEFIPGPQGERGPQGEAGPAIFLLQDAEENDVFWPIKNT